jgi:hypothetical protein
MGTATRCAAQLQLLDERTSAGRRALPRSRLRGAGPRVAAHLVQGWARGAVASPGARAAAAAARRPAAAWAALQGVSGGAWVGGLVKGMVDRQAMALHISPAAPWQPCRRASTGRQPPRQARRSARHQARRSWQQAAGSRARQQGRTCHGRQPGHRRRRRRQRRQPGHRRRRAQHRLGHVDRRRVAACHLVPLLLDGPALVVQHRPLGGRAVPGDGPVVACGPGGGQVKGGGGGGSGEAR